MRKREVDAIAAQMQDSERAKVLEGLELLTAAAKRAAESQENMARRVKLVNIAAKYQRISNHVAASMEAPNAAE